jgi:glycosyltransferase involved in cell wall biosynthesis
MIKCFIYSQIRFLALLTWIPKALPEHGWIALFKRLFIFILGIPLFWSLQILHWFGMLLDALFFPSWKSAKVHSPVFITGIPRSGTTFLHRTLAQDNRFTSTPTWELVFAPSISEKVFWTKVGRFLRPLRSYLGTQAFFSKMEAIHSLKLDEPEEDFLFFLQLNSCFILFALFPSAKGLWRLSRFDKDLPKWERKLIMGYYKACVQKHLYFQNILDDSRHYVYLSKNPSFASMTDSLKQTFKSAKFIVCARPPQKTVASQISSLKPAFELLGNGQLPEGFVEKCISMLRHYYACLNQSLIATGAAPLLLNRDIHSDLQNTVEKLYSRWGWEVSAEFGSFLHEQSEKSRNYRSSHSYSLKDFGLDDAEIEARFKDVWPMHTDASADFKTLQRKPELRIAIVSDAAPHRNGVGSYYEDLERHLTDQVDAIITLSPTIQNGKWSGGLAIPLPGDSTQKVLLPNVFKLHRQLRDFRPTVVILPAPGPYGFIGLALGKLLGATVITGFHTWFEKLGELYWSRWQNRMNQAYLKISNSILFSCSEYVLVNSKFMAKTAKEIRNCNTRLVGTPVSYDFVHSPVSAHSGALKKVLFVGRLAAEKNLEAVIQAARKLPDLQFDIAGDGPDRESVEKAAGKLKNLNYIGWVNRAELLRLIDDHDILALPSHVESFGTVALEAMSRQRLALVSRHCGIADWQDLSAGLLVIGKGETLATALKRLSQESDASRISMAETARKCAVDQNQWNLDQWKELLTQAADRF